MHIAPHYLVASHSFPSHFQHSWVECNFHGSCFTASFFFPFFFQCEENLPPVTKQTLHWWEISFYQTLSMLLGIDGRSAVRIFRCN